MGDLISVFGVDWRLLLAQSLNFLILLGILSYFLYKPTMKVLADRAQKIKEGLDAAEAAQKERTQVMGERDGIIAEANHQGEMIVARAEEEGKSERSTILKTAQDRAEALLKDAQLEADESKRRALRESQEEIARAAVLAAEKILRTNQ